MILVHTGSDAQLRAEVLALRHQLGVLERKVGKPAWQPADRVLLAALSQLLPRSGWSALLPKPVTLLRWHRDLVRHKWEAFRRRPPRQRPSRDPERRALILKLAEENPRWGYKRIQGEALKLGFKISHMGVAKILRSQGIPPAPRRSQTTWRGGRLTPPPLALLARVRDPEPGEPRSAGLATFVVEKERHAFPPGLRGEPIDKVGYHGMTTWHLWFEGLRVPDANRVRGHRSRPGSEANEAPSLRIAPLRPPCG